MTPTVAHWATARPGRYAVPGYDRLYKTDYPLDSTDGGQPFAYLIEQAPGTVIRPHFHTVEQFQVIVGGDGAFGRRPVRPPFCHYAGPFTGYGPIEAGPEGLRYLTLRQRTPVPFSEQERPVPARTTGAATSRTLPTALGLRAPRRG